MANVMIDHQIHAIGDAVVLGDRDHLSGHDLGNPRGLGGLVLQNHLAGVVALGHHAHQFVVDHHRQGADVSLRHHGNRLEDAFGGRDGEHLALAFAAFQPRAVVQNIVDGLHGLLQPLGK